MSTVDFDLLATQLEPRLAKHGRLSAVARTIDVTADVQCVQLSIVNCYLVGDPHAWEPEWVLVDAGLWNSAGTILRAAEERFGPDCPPKAIILTHGHFDHVGAVEELQTHWNVPVYIHRLEIPYVTGQSSYPPPDPTVGGGAMSYLSSMYPRGPFTLNNVRALPADGSVPHMHGWKWIATPGHTPGHVSLWRESDRLLIAGDAFVTTQQESALAVLTQRAKVCRPPAYYTTDWQAARKSVERLAALNPTIVATGHGVPMRGYEMQRQLRSLARNWRWNMPWFGRYVKHPALADERGVVYVPPATVSPQLVALAGLGIGLAIGGMMLRSRQQRCQGW
jgi:glyoxylase-like metal-dependent hydrolase (beta-lactamase superfamily II)